MGVKGNQFYVRRGSGLMTITGKFSDYTKIERVEVPGEGGGIKQIKSFDREKFSKHVCAGVGENPNPKSNAVDTMINQFIEALMNECATDKDKAACERRARPIIEELRNAGTGVRG